MTHDDLEKSGIRLHAIVAMAPNRVIGRDGTLPWHLPEDLKLFKKRTVDHPIVMGRLTFESLPGRRPLPRRRHLVLSRTMAPEPGIEVIPSLDSLPDLGVEGDAYLIGGARIFEAYLSACSTVILSLLHKEHPGDTLMPEFEKDFPTVETLEQFPDFNVIRYSR